MTSNKNSKKEMNQSRRPVSCQINKHIKEPDTMIPSSYHEEALFGHCNNTSTNTVEALESYSMAG